MSNDLHNLKPIREVISSNNLRPNKKLGQNFLFNLEITDKIVRLAGDVRKHPVLEIGAGPGALTRSILNAGAESLIIIEKDSSCVSALQEVLDAAGNRVTMIEGDALNIDMGSLSDSPLKLIANLPYNVATLLLFSWLEKVHLFESMTLMFQKEVAGRIAAEPNTKAYGRVSIMCQWLCHTEVLFDIPPEAFIPPPKVTSSVISIIPRKKPLFPAEYSKLEALVKVLFSQRRKNLRNNIKLLTDNPEEFLEKIDINPKSRPENLTMEQVSRIYNAVYI